MAVVDGGAVRRTPPAAEQDRGQRFGLDEVVHDVGGAGAPARFDEVAVRKTVRRAGASQWKGFRQLISGALRVLGPI